MKPVFEVHLLAMAVYDPLRALALWEKYRTGLRNAEYASRKRGKGAEKKVFDAMMYSGWLRVKFGDILADKAEYYFKDGKAYWLNAHGEAIIKLRRSEGATL